MLWAVIERVFLETELMPWLKIVMMYEVGALYAMCNLHFCPKNGSICERRILFDIKLHK